MRFYEIALFLFILNMSLGYVSTLPIINEYFQMPEDTNFTGAFMPLTRDFGNETTVLRTVGFQEQAGTLGILSDLLRGMLLFVRFMFYALFLSGVIYVKLGFPQGIATIMWMATSFIYFIAIYQMVSGKNTKSMD